ncbi:MAG: hypothetical protein ACXU8Q_05510 [Caulobacteraceae bacterium]
MERSASTARVLNLLATHKRDPADLELAAQPFFENRILNRSIILKHRLRPHEQLEFGAPSVSTVTKVLIPIDQTDLRAGARSFFVGQSNFEDLLDHAFGADLRPCGRDRRVLDLLAELPSLDPFLLRERMRANDLHAARGYFAISDADIHKMTEFVRDEIQGLVELTARDKQATMAATVRLVDKLLSNAPDSGFAPLKDTLGLTDQQYSEGVFGWRGFLYYKWVCRTLGDSDGSLLNEILNVRGRAPYEPEAVAYVTEAKRRIGRRYKLAHQNVHRLLSVYDEAYKDLTLRQKPGLFKSFLLSAPTMFSQLGEQLGGIQHIASFWTYRVPRGKPPLIGWEELADIFTDFEDGLSMQMDEAA